MESMAAEPNETLDLVTLRYILTLQLSHTTHLQHHIYKRKAMPRKSFYALFTAFAHLVLPK